MRDYNILYSYGEKATADLTLCRLENARATIKFPSASGVT